MAELLLGSGLLGHPLLTLSVQRLSLGLQLGEPGLQLLGPLAKLLLGSGLLGHPLLMLSVQRLSLGVQFGKPGIQFLGPLAKLLLGCGLLGHPLLTLFVQRLPLGVQCCLGDAPSVDLAAMGLQAIEPILWCVVATPS